jgi:hypothetical protein
MIKIHFLLGCYSWVVDVCVLIWSSGQISLVAQFYIDFNKEAYHVETKAPERWI